MADEKWKWISKLFIWPKMKSGFRLLNTLDTNCIFALIRYFVLQGDTIKFGVKITWNEKQNSNRQNSLITKFPYKSNYSFSLLPTPLLVLHRSINMNSLSLLSCDICWLVQKKSLSSQDSKDSFLINTTQSTYL